MNETTTRHDQMLALAVPLDRIHADDDLRTVSNPDADHQLEASIRSLGLLQPLVVCKHPDGRRKNAYRLLAGYRRYRALCNIHVDTPDMLVPVMQPETTPDGADFVWEVGLAENMMRMDMHVADVAMAMQALIEAGQGADNIAGRFGVSRRTVRRAARLSVLDPRILQDLREGKCSLALAQALTKARSRKHGWHLYEPLEEHENPGRRHLGPSTVPCAKA